MVCRRPHEAARRTTPCTLRPGPARGPARRRTHHSPPVKVPDAGDENAAPLERRGAGCRSDRSSSPAPATRPPLSAICPPRARPAPRGHPPGQQQNDSTPCRYCQGTRPGSAETRSTYRRRPPRPAHQGRDRCPALTAWDTSGMVLHTTPLVKSLAQTRVRFVVSTPCPARPLPARPSGQRRRV